MPTIKDAEAGIRRPQRSGTEYDDLFPQAAFKDTTIKRGATVADTISFIPKVVDGTRWQTAKLARLLKGATVYDSCRNIWEWVYDHIGYQRDADRKEQIRSPARSWADRYRGVDCDCYTTFISTILSNLHIPHTYRITRYQEQQWEHIYPIVPTSGGRYITIDCVCKRFDYEVPFTEKQDNPMDLQYLSGLPDMEQSYHSPYNDFHLYTGGSGELSELGKIIRKKAAQRAAAKIKSRVPPSGGDTSLQPNRAPAVSVTAPAKKRKGKGLFVVNRINPATALLRNGFLASMKLNIKSVAERLRWTYLPETEAVKRGIDINRYREYLKKRQQLENLFYKAGGKPDNLRKAILTGKGNKDKAVNGLGYTGVEGAGNISEEMSLPQILGIELYTDENHDVLYGYRDERVEEVLDGFGLNGFQGLGMLGELGEPATAAGMAAVAAIIGGIATALDKIGTLFPGKDKSADTAPPGRNPPADSSTAANSPRGATNPPASSSNAANAGTGDGDTNVKPFVEPGNTNLVNPTSEGSSGSGSGKENNFLPATTQTAEPGSQQPAKEGSGKADPDTTPAGWQKHKKWAVPTLIGTGLLLTGVLAYKAFTHKRSSPVNGNRKVGLSGTPGKKNHHRKKRKNNPHQKSSIRTVSLS
jgi:hypothetical protein